MLFATTFTLGTRVRPAKAVRDRYVKAAPVSGVVVDLDVNRHGDVEYRVVWWAKPDCAFTALEPHANLETFPHDPHIDLVRSASYGATYRFPTRRAAVEGLRVLAKTDNPEQETWRTRAILELGEGATVEIGPWLVRHCGGDCADAD